MATEKPTPKRNGMSRQEAGRKGGETTARKHDMSKIGRKGGETTKAKYGPDFYESIGRKGGEEVSKNRKHMSTIGRTGGKK